jgi:uncharacterized protein YecE (DUF72 family)
MSTIRIGTAGWTIPAQLKEEFAGNGTHLERYARTFNCVEINSSFYRDHKPETYSKWASSTPEDFVFSVKLSKYFTQEKRLSEANDRLKETLKGIAQLGEKWGALLVQLPPSLKFDAGVSVRFLDDLRRHYSGAIVWEPRHLSWTSHQAIELLASHGISKVLADPEPCRIGKTLRPRVEKTRYFRLHGTPEIYKSRYSAELIERIAFRLQNPLSEAKQTWIIFDNTTYGLATENAGELLSRLAIVRTEPRPFQDILRRA